MRQKDKVAYDERYLWEQFNRPFGTRRTILADPPLKGWAILESPSGRRQVSHFHMAKNVQTPGNASAFIKFIPLPGDGAPGGIGFGNQFTPLLQPNLATLFFGRNASLRPLGQPVRQFIAFCRAKTDRGLLDFLNLAHGHKLPFADGSRKTGIEL